jgi:hypothetical protein
MKKAEAFDIFYSALFDAISKIHGQYYRVKLAYFNQTIYREHVYCYELYHQLRKILGEDFPYSLSGEVDRASHPDIVERCLEFKSDLLVHQPGIINDDSFLAIVNVFSLANAFRVSEKLIENFNKMVCATTLDGGYYRGIMLIYGDETKELDRGIYDIYKNYCRGCYDKIILLYHNSINDKPVHITINQT